MNSLALGGVLKLRDLHPEYEYPTVALLCRCRGCGNYDEIHGTDGSIDRPYVCHSCQQDGICWQCGAGAHPWSQRPTRAMHPDLAIDWGRAA